jgi:hypothetical protein
MSRLYVRRPVKIGWGAYLPMATDSSLAFSIAAGLSRCEEVGPGAPGVLSSSELQLF